jgi:hypothetical protein
VLVCCWALPANAQRAASIDIPAKWVEQRCMLRSLSDEKFRACVERLIEGLPKLDPAKREHFGQAYDPREYVRCRMKLERNQTDCEHFILRRREWPEYWPENAKRITWPDSPKESVYRRGMKPKEYWEALCKAEAGEFIYKTVKDVEGFLLVRPRSAETDDAMRDKYVIEDAYGLREFYSTSLKARPGISFLDRSSKTYRYVEARIILSTGERRNVRHEADISKLRDLRKNKANEKWGEEDFSRIVEVAVFDSRYGVTWRGVRRERDLELGVSGGELAVVDLVSGQTLALRRGFALDPLAAKGERDRRWWLGSSGCPIIARDFVTLIDFVRRVLLPKDL